jgi:transposase
VSTDPAVVTKLRDMVGLYVNPPQRAVVFSMDEKRQIQALDRTQPGPPLKKGRAGTVTHDDKRHGTTTLFAALNVGTGTVQHECRPKHTQKNFLAFMTRVERTVPRGVSIHVILDNYSTHKTPDVAKWLRRHRRVHFHFTPTSASWLNLVALLFNELSRRQLRRLAVTSVDELIATITTYLDRRNEAPTPFIWTASVRSILAKVRKAQGTLASDH